jgi:hypothetical protein
LADAGLDLDRARETFDASADFTIGLEEEFAIVDPQSTASMTSMPPASPTRSLPSR